MAAVSEGQAETIRKTTGLDVSGYTHTLDDSAIRHIRERHEKGRPEAGELPVTDSDLRLLPKVVKEPDAVRYVGKTRHGLDGFRFEKRINGVLFYVTEVRTRKKELAATTMWKVRKPKK